MRILIPALLCAACSQRPARPSAVLLTLDTTIPEALSCYSQREGKTPNLDRLAAEGLLFEQARTTAPITLPAHTSMLTGLTPLRHSVRRNGSTAVPSEARTLAEAARAEGLATAAFVAAVVLDAEFGLDQGFDVYDDPPTSEDTHEHLNARPAGDIVDRGLAWLEGLPGDRPFFLWLHFYDPHFPYRPPPGFLEGAGGDPYLAEVDAMDAAIGRFLEALEESGRRESTWVLAVADHGEGRGRHGEETHGYFVFDSTLRVPLIVSPPPTSPARSRAGERVGEPVSVVDVFPTLASALELEIPADLDGVDLLGPREQRRGLYFESYFGVVAFHWSQLAGWTDGRMKFIHSSAPELYDVVADPGETHNLFDERPDVVSRLRASLERHCALPRLRKAELPPDYLGLTKQIEQLGYAGADSSEEGTPEPLEPSSWPSPHQRIEAYRDFTTARKLMEEEQDWERAARLLQRVVATHPANHKAQFNLGLCLKALGRFTEAVGPFRAALQYEGGERIPAELNLAVCLYNLGRVDLAIDHLRNALRDTIGPPGAMDLLIRLLEEQGRTAEALRYRQRLQAATGT